MKMKVPTAQRVPFSLEVLTEEKVLIEVEAPTPLI
jgi:hypothetical protein